MDVVVRHNRRGHQEFAVQAEHLKLPDLGLRLKAQDIHNNYLFKDNIPEYPRPEFWVSQLRHDTDEYGLFGIAVESEGGFCARDREEGPEDPEEGPKGLDLLWWSLSLGAEEMASAEQRLLQTRYPDRTEEQAREQKSFLQRFATSPAFLDTSRLGSYRFTFPLEELLKRYQEQLCVGHEPILRVYETVLYKQEVMYSVLVHSHYNNDLFEKYPLLQDNDDGVCAYRDGQIIWRPEAMCQTHSFKLVPKPYQNQDVAHLIPDPQKHQFYLWDNIAVAFHMDGSQMLTFDRYNLRHHLRFCEPGTPQLSPDCEFTTYEEAKDMVDCYWPYYHTPLF
ncbi:uncharacterized protein LOC115187461 [Salmo trutta]|uniref:uncharacterized protein LOC115187461 n=1 Tax=Salmo trutta TaxID=8032 RepID=UPI0011320FEE|nr:uncharacterized protein LOC115187461 [Salmo trutta]